MLPIRTFSTSFTSMISKKYEKSFTLKIKSFRLLKRNHSFFFFLEIYEEWTPSMDFRSQIGYPTIRKEDIP